MRRPYRVAHRVRREMIIALLLAAGEAKRMGKNKLLLPLQGKPMVVLTLENLLASQVDEIIVVTGHEGARLEKELGPFLEGRPGRIKVVRNKDYQQGMSTSLKAGAEAAKGRADALLIMLGDQPFIGPELINRIIARFKTGRAKICLPLFRGQPGHPVLFHGDYLSEMASLSGDVGARGIVESHPEDVVTIEVDSPEVLVDIDEESQYEAVQGGAKSP